MIPLLLTDFNGAKRRRFDDHHTSTVLLMSGSTSNSASRRKNISNHTLLRRAPRAALKNEYFSCYSLRRGQDDVVARGDLMLLVSELDQRTWTAIRTRSPALCSRRPFYAVHFRSIVYCNYCVVILPIRLL